MAEPAGLVTMEPVLLSGGELALVLVEREAGVASRFLFGPELGAGLIQVQLQ